MSQRCKVCNDTVIRSQVDRMIDDGMSDDAISRAIVAAGVDVPPSLVMRHRIKHYTPSESAPSESAPLDVGKVSDDAESILNTVRDDVESNDDIGIAKARLVRETLLQKILESQLAITAAAIEKYRKGEGRYPNDIVRATATTWGLFEKTTLHTMAAGETKESVFESEVVRLERIAYETALAGDDDDDDPPQSMFTSVNDFGEHEYFRFGGYVMTGTEFNERIRKAWRDGIKAKKPKGVDDETR